MHTTNDARISNHLLRKYKYEEIDALVANCLTWITSFASRIRPETNLSLGIQIE